MRTNGRPDMAPGKAIFLQVIGVKSKLQAFATGSQELSVLTVQNHSLEW